MVKPGDSGAHRGGIDARWKSFAQLQGMEDLTIDEIRLDEKQARVSIDAVPDRPGTAAALFQGGCGGGDFCRHDRAKLQPRRQSESDVHGAGGRSCRAAPPLRKKSPSNSAAAA